MELDYGYLIVVGFRLFLGYSLLFFMISFMYKLFCRFWDMLFDFLSDLKIKKC